MLRCLRRAVALAAFVVVTAIDASAIIRRHDRSDERYLELGSKFPAVVQLGGDSATLIDPRWLLTAAHVTAALSPFNRSVRFGEQTCLIEAVIEHPMAHHEAGRQRMDIALVRLATPVQGVAPIGLYEANDELGKPIVVAGVGMIGDGITGPQGEDGKLRAGTNIVTQVLENYIVFPFDPPAQATDLEGISGPGDSGGPAIIELHGKPRVAGVSSGNRQGEATGTCRYASTEYYARVSAARDWIVKTMAADTPASDSASQAVDLRSEPWPAGRSAEIAAEFFKAYRKGDLPAFETFEREYRAASALAERSAAERAASWRTRHADWGELRVAKGIQRGAIFHVLVKAERENVWKAIGFEVGEAGKLSGISISSPVAGEP